MKRADPQPTRIGAEQLGDARAHLAGRLVGESHGENSLRGDAALGDQIRDSRRQHARLARSGAGEHEQRSSGIFDGLTLGGIEG